MIKKKENKQKRYVIWEGKRRGIFSSWKECEALVKGYPGAKYKAFENENSAKNALAEGSDEYYKKNNSSNSITPLVSSIEMIKKKENFQKNSIAVDAACSGNPGVMEYQGIDLQTGKQIIYQKFEEGTNNIGEFLALVHALSYLKKNKLSATFIYTDSKIAMNWVKQKKCKTLAKIGKDLEAVIQRAVLWLKNNTYDEKKILKRPTKERGEIPADFGRK